MRRTMVALSVVALLATAPAWAALEFVEGSEGSWDVTLYANGESWGTTTYHVFLTDDGSPGGFGTAYIQSNSGVGLNAGAWQSRLVDSHYFQMWTYEYPANANYTGDRFTFRMAGPSTTPISIVDVECSGDPDDLNFEIAYCYTYNGGWSGGVCDGEPPVLTAPSDQSPELSTMALLLASFVGGTLLRRRRQ